MAGGVPLGVRVGQVEDARRVAGLPGCRSRRRATARPTRCRARRPPRRSTQPAVASRPPGPATGLTRALSIASVTAARASGAIGQRSGFAAHHLVKLSNASSKPLAWLSAPATVVLPRVDRAVEHQGAHVAREQLGVRRAEQRAVRVAEVGQLRRRPRRPGSRPCRGRPARSRRGAACCRTSPGTSSPILRLSATSASNYAWTPGPGRSRTTRRGRRRRCTPPGWTGRPRAGRSRRCRTGW